MLSKKYLEAQLHRGLQVVNRMTNVHRNRKPAGKRMPQATSRRPLSPWQIAVAGMTSLAVAMGIGRFAFTPLLPMMLAEGKVTLSQASWLASSNYLGYLLGALLCMLQPWIWRQLGIAATPSAPSMVQGGLVTTVALTLGMALPWADAWPVLRFCAGVTSAIVFVYTSGWCLTQLAQLQFSSMGALIYIGPGAGIVISGLAASAMVATHWSASSGWQIFGLLAALLTAGVWPIFGSGVSAVGATATAPAAQLPLPGVSFELPLFTLAYGLAGFGYIITASFLPVIARQSLPDSHWLDLFWPLFGLGVMAGALLASRIRGVQDLRWLLIGSYLVQAIGIACSLISPSLPGFTLGSLLLGLPFTAITFFAMQEVRRLRPAQAASFMGLATALYGIGQIMGPPLATTLLAHSDSTTMGFTRSLEIAACSLLAGAGIYACLIFLYPNVQPRK